MDLFDYIISGARVINPATCLDDVMDIAISGKLIAHMDKTITNNDPRFATTTKIIDASSCLVTPGWVDLHCHFYPDDYYGLMPDDPGVLSGCTSIVDGGSAGMLTYSYFFNRYMDRSKSKTYAFLLHHPIGQFFQEECWKNVFVNAKATAEFVKQTPRIVGLKDKLTADFAWYQGIEGVRRAIDIAHLSEKPYAVHLGTSTHLVTPDKNASADAVENAVRSCTLELLASLRKGILSFMLLQESLVAFLRPMEYMIRL